MNSIQTYQESQLFKTLQKASKNFLLETAKTGLAGMIIGYCVCQISGANPVTYGLAYHAARVARLVDSISCKALLRYGPPTATNKTIALNASLLVSFAFFYQALNILGYQDLRKEIFQRIQDNGFALQAGALVVFCNTVLLASDVVKHPLMIKIQEAAKDAMQYRSDEFPGSLFFNETKEISKDQTSIGLGA
jgi:hypothetical protein